MKEDPVNKPCTRTNNVKHKSWESEFMCVHFVLIAGMKDVLDQNSLRSH